MIKIQIFHNILWSKYKGSVFSALSDLALKRKFDVGFVQIAETEGDRIGLSKVDTSYHRYTYKLLFKGDYNKINVIKLSAVLIKEVIKSKYDLIVLPGYHRPEYWAMLFACILIGKKRAVFCDSTAFDKPSCLYKMLAKRAFFYFCNGYFGYGLRSRSYMLGFGAKANRIFHGCQAAALPHDYSTETAIKQRIRLVQRFPYVRFLYVGRLSEEKGLEGLLDAFKIVLADLPFANLVLVGSGNLRETLEEKSSLIGIADHVEFKGGMETSDLVFEYSKANCLVLPSISEPWGLVVNEALSYGCPVVVSNVCGCVPELVRRGITGFDFQSQDINELADCLVKVGRNFDDYEKVAKCCIELISTYSPERAAQQIFDGSTVILKEQ